MRCLRLSLLALLALFNSLAADTVSTLDGSTLRGHILGIEGGKLRLETPYAGVIVLDQKQVTSFTTDEPVSMRLESGSTMTGPVTQQGGQLAIQSADGTLLTTPAKVAASWKAGEKDPAIVAAEKASERRWKYTAGVNINGKTGNSDQFNAGLKLTADLLSKDDELNLYFKLDHAKSEGDKTRDETVGGVKYTSFFHDKWGWFVREELENDKFEGVDFRSTTAAGFSYRWINRPNQKLKASIGLGYRYESLLVGEDTESPSLDLGLVHDYRHDQTFSIDTDIKFVPSVEDFSEYLLTHDSGIVVPLTKDEFWKLRVGMSNSYNSEPSAGRRELDTTYYSGLVLEWF